MDPVAFGLWFLVVLNALGIIAVILTVGQPREPRTPGEAVASLIVGMLTIAVLLAAIYR